MTNHMTRTQVDAIDDLADAIMDLPADDALTIINNRRQELSDAELAHLRFRLPQFTF